MPISAKPKHELDWYAHFPREPDSSRAVMRADDVMFWVSVYSPVMRSNDMTNVLGFNQAPT